MPNTIVASIHQFLGYVPMSKQTIFRCGFRYASEKSKFDLMLRRTKNFSLSQYLFLHIKGLEANSSHCLSEAQWNTVKQFQQQILYLFSTKEHESSNGNGSINNLMSPHFMMTVEWLIKIIVVAVVLETERRQ